jgi:hypothetical protein
MWNFAVGENKLFYRFRFPPLGGFDRLNHRCIAFGFHRWVVSTGSTTAALLSVSTAGWFRQAQPPLHCFGFPPLGGFDRLNHRCIALGFHRRVVSTGSTTDALLSVSTAGWFRQAQPPMHCFRFPPLGGFDRLNHRCIALGFHRWVVSTGSTTAALLSVSTAGGFDRLNHRCIAFGFHRWWFRQAQPPLHCFGFPPLGGFDRLNHRCIAFGFHRWVVSTGSTTDALLSVSTAGWFRQAQPPMRTQSISSCPLKAHIKKSGIARAQVAWSCRPSSISKYRMAL